MMRNIREYAKEKGFEATHHLAAKVNEAANRLYERMGYRKVGLIHVYDTDFNAYEKLLSGME
jgi:ribosomal protein S18 acetylase RimI-like enzyme